MLQAINKTFALILISFYLILPATAHANGNALQGNKRSVVSVKEPAGDSPCDDCPCPEAQDADCSECNCFCSCHAPLTKHVSIAYSPLVSNLHYPESQPALPQVFQAIFVPPQNFSA